MTTHIRSYSMKQAVRTGVLICLSAWLLTAAALCSAEGMEISPQTYKKVVKAREYISEEKYGDAEALLLEQKERSKRKKFDHIEVLRTLGYLYAARSQYGKAMQVFEEAMKVEGLPPELARELRYNLAQMYMAQDLFAKAAPQLEIYLQESEQAKQKPGSAVYLALANCYSQQKQYAKVIPVVRKAIATESKAQESWLQLLLAAHYELKEYDQAVNVLKELLLAYPEKKQYWKQLSGVYMQLKKDAAAVAVLEMAYRRDMLEEEKEFVNLANYLAYQNAPLRAGKIMEDGMQRGVVVSNGDNLRKLAGFWRQARERKRAIDAYKAALQQQVTGDTQLDLAYQLYENEDYRALVDLLNAPATDMSEEQKGRALLLKGQAYYNLEQSQEALATMREASRFDASAPAAKRWISFLTAGAEQ
ncbi:tetratricopeptide repeat protein [Hahella sp. KA22]|uniref:tetratricopeptide repeat protein n=1 Tax=Hahella sp. KA22 TaxID=1628392 RepID=UPI000FDE8DB2|nr:tetratricopeptide repeat protein [Hahella sp. KA22]AZZ94285.1 tetratricopeptide repeat protein [Hahella sp. KA22]QAY57659.1 tetratricopeptide repeat protein [Hahella sp. KA22]